MKRILFSLILPVCVLATIQSCGNSRAGAAYDPDAQQMFIGKDIALVQTQYGKIKGLIYKGVYTFLGVPYGASTAGENRFMPPVAPKAWDGVLPTVWYPASAPQAAPSFSSDSYASFRDEWNYDGISEDCLKLNIWTPATDNKARPVLVWLHGGGFSFGNGVEQDGYMGHNFARLHDAVFVSLNHRLNSFGFSDFAGVGGEKYKHSGNVGMLDIIFALQWVHNNIAQFGGDSKVTIISAMPAAKGLVSKGVALSGGSTKASSKEDAEALGAQILKTAGLKPSEIDKLQQMPWEEYYALANKAASELAKTLSKDHRYFGFSPVADDVDIPTGDFYTLGRDDVPSIPMILCTTTNEFVSDRDTPEKENLSKEEIVKMISEQYGDNAEAIYNEFDKIFPGNSPFGIYTIVSASRKNVIQIADNKTRQGQPVYLAWFNWYPPLFDGLPRAFHCLDISFWFNNTDFMPSHSGGGKVPRKLSEKMADALASFMRTGNPNTNSKKGLPAWPEYTAQEGATMILNNDSRAVNAPDRKALELMSK